MNESPLKKYFEPSAFKKTIAKDAGIPPLEPTDVITGGMEGVAEAAAKAASIAAANKVPKLRKIEKRIEKKNPNIHTGPRDFEPAWEGADISEERWNNMSKSEQDAYTERYGD